MSSQKFIARNRAPRVHLEYDVQLYGAQRKIALPFVVGVLADLCGDRREPLPGVQDRTFLEVSIDNFDERLKALQPRAAFQVPDTLAGSGMLDVDLVFESMDDFSPVAILRKIAPVRELGDARERLANLVTYSDGKSDAERLIAEVLRDPSRLQALVADAEQGADAPFAVALATALKPQSERALKEVQVAIRTMATQALKTPPVFEGTDGIEALRSMIASMDETLSRQMIQVLHHPAFQHLEAGWRGLHYLVNNTETDETLKIRVFSVSKKELQRTLRRFKGEAWDQSPIFKKLYDDELGTLGGEPYGCLVGDYYFDHSLADHEVLGELSKICQAVQAPFITGAAPALLQLESWQELNNPRDIGEILKTPEYAAWRALRESEGSLYLGLTMPRFLARLPYGSGNPVETFDFQEATEGSVHSAYVWANSAYAMATNITRAFRLYGWCSRIRGVESGGAVEGLSHSFPSDDGSLLVEGPTEVGITDRREAELAKLGFMPLIQRKNSDHAFFVGARSLHRPPIYDDPDATANASLAARLPYLFANCRFAHYLMCIARDQLGVFKTKDQVQQALQSWIIQFVDGDPAHSSEESKARKPLAAAEIVIEDVEGEPWRYTTKLFLRPHYQLEGLSVSQRVLVRLPAARST